MTGLKDRQRLALYVALGLSAGSGLTLDASTAYAHDIPLNADHTGTYVANAAAGDNVVASQPTGGSTPTITDGDIVGSKAANAKNVTVTVNSVKAESAGYGRVYAALSTGEISNNHIVYNNGVVNELLAAASVATAAGSTQNIHDNDVKVTGGTVHNNVIGGIGGNGTNVKKNEVTISGGNLKTVNGGIGKNGSIVNDNTVTITGGTFTVGRIVGGETGTTGTAKGNKVVLGAKDGTFDSHTDLKNSTLWGSRYVGSNNNGVISSGDARITGTALEVNAQDVKVKRTHNFQTYQFNLNKKLANNATMLTVTEGFGAGANVQWNDIQLDVSGWQDKPTDLGSKYYGKNDLTLLKTSDGTTRLLDIANGTSSLTRTGLSGDFEYHLATDNPAVATAANGAVSVAKVTAAVNRIRNAKAFYDGENVDGNVVRGGYSEFSPAEKDKIYHVTNNRLTVSHLPTGGLDAAYGGEVAGLAGSVLGNALYVRNTDDQITPTPNHETLTNAYGGAITKSANAGDVKHNGVTISGGKVQNAYGGYTAGNGTVEDNRVFLSGGTVQNAYGGKSDRNGTVIDNVVSVMGGGTVSDAYGAYASGAAALTHNSVLIDGGTAKGTTYGAKSTSGDVDKNEVFVRSGSAAHIVGADSATGKVSNSRVMIAGGTVGTAMTRGTITGAQSADGRVTDNGVTMTGGVIHGDVYAVKTTGNGTAQGNFIRLGDEDHRDLTQTAAINFSDADLIGAAINYATASSGNNDLRVYAKNAAVHSVSKFDNYRFDIARGITDGATMLTISEGGFGDVIDGSKIIVENKEKLMEKGNPGGQIKLAQGNATHLLKFKNNANKHVDLTNTASYKNIEYVLELTPDTLDETEAGVSKADALLLTYAKFKDNVWAYDAAQDPSERDEVFGGISYYDKHDTDNNNLTVDGVKKDLEAAYGGKTNGLANATNNHVVINRTNYNVPGLGKIKKVIGGYTQAPYTVSNNVEMAGVAAGNEVVVYDGTVSEGLYGGYTKGNKGKARSNKAIVGGGSVANVYGGIATENGGEATENKAEIYGGTVTNVYGGAVGKVDAAATKNKVQVRGGTVTGEIAGARAVYDTTPTATHTLSNGNNVMLGSEEPTRALDMNVAGASVYGTDYRDVTSGVAGTPELTFDSASDQIKDNELIVTTTGVSAKKVRNFDSYTFVLGDNFENKDTMLTLTEAGGFGTVSNAASNPAVKVDWGKVKANTSKLTDRRGGGIHGRNNFTLMQEVVPGTGTTISYPRELAFANYTDTAGIAEIDRVYEKKMTADVAPAAGSTDTSANKVLLELNRFRNDEVTHKGTEAQTPSEVYGGYSGYDHTEKVSGVLTTLGTTTESNILNIEGIANGTTLKAYGGYTGGARGGSKDNAVHINLEELPGNVASGDLDSVYGGYAEGANAGAVSGNIVTFSQGATLHDLMGGYLKSTTSTSDVSGNQVFIAGGEFNNAVATDPAPRIYGGATDGSGTATRNVLQITVGTIGNATHAADVVGGRSATGAAEENHVVLGAAEPGATPTAPALKGNVTGGYGATATDNTVEILAGTLTGSVYGGYATTAGTPATTGASPTAEVSALRNNKVTLRDGVTVTGNVYGGYAAADASNMTAATDSNTINLYKAVIGGTIYGGMAQDAAGHDVVSGKNNTLAVHGYDSKAGDFAGVQNLNFYLPEDVKNDPLNDVNAPTMLKLTNVTNVDANGKKDLSNIKVGVELDARRAVLHSGDNISLMTAYNANTPVELTPDHLIKAPAEGRQDALRYKFELVTVPTADAVAVPTTTGGTAAVNNKLIAKVTEAALDPQTKSLVETRAASMAFINSGSDLLTDAAMTAAMEAAATPASESQAGRARVDGTPKEYGMWAVQNVSSMRLNSGSHVDAKGWGLNLGFAKQRVSGRNTLTYGPFVEYGKGSYDSYLDDGLHGSGDMDYLGVGVMAKSQSQNGAYVEGSVRVGRVKSDYAGTIADTHRTYDSSSTYYAGHLGVGQEKQLKNGNTIDTYAKYFFAHQGGDTVRLSNGAVYDFDAANSHRIRFGTRYTSKKGDASFYTGLAYEYEFGDDFAASYQGYNTPSPSLTGGTGILELGYRFAPQNGRATYGIQLMGMTGQRRGISGGVQMHWAF